MSHKEKEKYLQTVAWVFVFGLVMLASGFATTVNTASAPREAIYAAK